MPTFSSSQKATFKQQFKKRCFTFSIDIINITEILRNKRANWALIDQIIRSATSIGANVIEGGASNSKKEFIYFFQVAIKSAVETTYWLELLRELNLQQKAELDRLIIESIEIKKILATVIINTKNNSEL
jgi:four helix bundle protein